MNESRILQQLGTQDIGFIIRGVTDEGYELLDWSDRLKVRNGQTLLIENDGNIRVFEAFMEEGEEVEIEKKVLVPGKTFRYLPEDVLASYERLDVNGRGIRLVDLSGADPRLSVFGERLNGSVQKAHRLARVSVSEGVLHHGIIKGSQIVRPRTGNGSPLFGTQSNEPNESTRVAAFVSLPTYNLPDAYIHATSRYSDFQKAARALESMI